MNLKIFRVILTAHDFFFFASFDYRVGATQDAIHNYALMYALWNKARFASAYIPHYLEDLPSMGYYATPARPTGRSDYRAWKYHKPTHFDPVKVTYNSLTETSTSRMEKVTINIPLSSSYYKFRPLTNYEFFLLSTHEPKGLIRTGKKFSIARLQAQRLNDFVIKHGKHRPSHFVNLSDMPKGAHLLEGTLMYGFPTPLITDALIESDYIEVSQDERTYRIQIPATELYPAVANLISAS